MTLFWNTWNPLIYAIAGPPRYDGWFPTENDKLALKYTSSPSLCILLSPETSLTFLFLSWLGSSGASSPMSKGLRCNRTMSGSGCMALKMSCDSERTIRGLEKTCLHRYLPFLISFCTDLRNQHRYVIEHLLLTLGWHFNFVDQNYPWNSSTKASQWQSTHTTDCLAYWASPG